MPNARPLLSALLALALLAAPLANAQTSERRTGERLAPPAAKASAGYREIGWEDLLPKGWDPMAPFKGLDLARLNGAGAFRTLRLIRVPAALPALVTGIRVAAVYAPIGAIIGEWVGASHGLGLLMVQANARMQTPLLFAALGVLAAATLLLKIAVDRLTLRLIPWIEKD